MIYETISTSDFIVVKTTFSLTNPTSELSVIYCMKHGYITTIILFNFTIRTICFMLDLIPIFSFITITIQQFVYFYTCIQAECFRYFHCFRVTHHQFFDNSLPFVMLRFQPDPFLFKFMNLHIQILLLLLIVSEVLTHFYYVFLVCVVQYLEVIEQALHLFNDTGLIVQMAIHF